MSVVDEIEELLKAVKEKCPNVMIFQKTSFGKKPFESGVWKLWHKDNENVYLYIEVNNGMVWAIYPNKEFENKYPIDAEKICMFLSA